MLFQWDIHKRPGLWLEMFCEENPLDKGMRMFADDLVRGVRANQAELDQLIESVAAHWKVSRMPIVDRNILRAALCELFYMPDVPAKVTLNEALELARDFADEDTKNFVNGVLDKILRTDSRLQAKRAEFENVERGN